MSATLQIHNDPPSAITAKCLRCDDGRAFVNFVVGKSMRQTAVEWFFTGDEAIATAAMLRKAADDLEAAAIDARDSDLFRCPTCGEHFTSETIAAPTCHGIPAVNVPEDTIYCGTCNLGAESLDEHGCCPDCAEAFRLQGVAARQEHADYQRSVL